MFSDRGSDLWHGAVFFAVPACGCHRSTFFTISDNGQVLTLVGSEFQNAVQPWGTAMRLSLGFYKIGVTKRDGGMKTKALENFFLKRLETRILESCTE